MRFSQRDRQIFPNVRFEYLLRNMTVPQKSYLFQRVKNELGQGQDKTIFQLRLMFNQEIADDPDNDNSRDHNVFLGSDVDTAI